MVVDTPAPAVLPHQMRVLEEQVLRLRYGLKRARNVLFSHSGGGLPVEEIVSYAAKVGRTTSAPEYWQPGRPMIGFAPPAPPKELMRMGALMKLSHADVLGGAEDEEEGPAVGNGEVERRKEESADIVSEQQRALQDSDRVDNVPMGRDKTIQRQSSTLGNALPSNKRVREQEQGGQGNSAKRAKTILDLDDLSSSSDDEDSEL
jgi:hypothetical protein